MRLSFSSTTVSPDVFKVDNGLAELNGLEAFAAFAAFVGEVRKSGVDPDDAGIFLSVSFAGMRDGKRGVFQGEYSSKLLCSFFESEVN